MTALLFLAALMVPADVPAGNQPLVRVVNVEGTRRIPPSSILHYVSTRAGSRLAAPAIQADLKTLLRTGLFSDAEVSLRPANGDQVDLTYRVVERPWVSDFEIAADSDAVSERIGRFMKESRLEIKTAAPYDPVLARKAEISMREFLRMQKYPDAEAAISTQRSATGIRVRMMVGTGPKVPIREVSFTGNDNMSSRELRSALRVEKPARSWEFWSRAGAWSAEEMKQEEKLLLEHYQSHGYAAVVVGPTGVTAGEFHAEIPWPLSLLGRRGPGIAIQIPIAEGPRYRLGSVRLEGDPKAAASDIRTLLDRLTPGDWYDRSLLETTRRQVQDLLGHHGYGLADVRLIQDRADAAREVHAVYRVYAGEPVLVGRIQFVGNKRLPDKFLRREMRTGEGRVFDLRALDASLDRLNRSGLVQTVRRDDAHLEFNQADNSLDITLQVRERDRNGIYGTGGTGGIGGSYLGFIYRAFNLLGLGEILSLELDGGAAQSNILLDLATSHFLGSSFGLALSAFNRLTDINPATIVPGPEDLVSWFRKRSAGIQLAGSYPISTRAQLQFGGLAYRNVLDEEVQEGNTPPLTGSVRRVGLTSGYVLDTTSGAGPGARGVHLGLQQAWMFTPGLAGGASAGGSFEFHKLVGDPWTSGRNSFVLQLEGSLIRPLGSGAVALDQRLYPGTEVVRGFGRGALTTWEVAKIAGTEQLYAAGTDAVLGLSAEYRVPLHGPLSGAAFMDLGWSGLHGLPGSSSSLGLIAATNHLLRASIGGELRLQLPFIGQQARIIGAWNPLRLDRLVPIGGRPARLADPRGAIRLALGGIF